MILTPAVGHCLPVFAVYLRMQGCGKVFRNSGIPRKSAINSVHALTVGTNGKPVDIFCCINILIRNAIEQEIVIRVKCTVVLSMDINGNLSALITHDNCARVYTIQI